MPPRTLNEEWRATGTRRFYNIVSVQPLHTSDQFNDGRVVTRERTSLVNAPRVDTLLLQIQYTPGWYVLVAIYRKKLKKQ